MDNTIEVPIYVFVVIMIITVVNLAFLTIITSNLDKQSTDIQKLNQRIEKAHLLETLTKNKNVRILNLKSGDPYILKF